MGFALMRTRRTACYKKVFKALSDKHEALTGRPLNPTLIVTDFEVRNKYGTDVCPYLIETIPKIFPLDYFVKQKDIRDQIQLLPNL
jgi:hypothetical protein